jgi:SAM-dependent methyltransferase
MTGSQSYDDVPRIGELYDHVPAYARRDLAFYIDVARGAGGPVLELGCGTGRVLLPTARQGVEITGLDRSAAMLSRLREKLGAEPSDVRGRVTVVEADMRELGELDLGRKFKLVTIPFRGFQHQIGVDDQLAVLRGARTHLAPGGRLAFDVFNPHFKLMVTRTTEEHEDSPRTALPGGRWFRRNARVPSVDFLTQVSQVELIWYVTDQSGREQRHVQAFPMRWFMRTEVEHLLARAGFRIAEIYGDVDRSPLVPDSPEMIFVAEPSSTP